MLIVEAAQEQSTTQPAGGMADGSYLLPCGKTRPRKNDPITVPTNLLIILLLLSPRGPCNPVVLNWPAFGSE